MKNQKRIKDALGILIASACITPATLLAQFIYPVSGTVPSGGQFGDCRDGCSRRHEGLDISGSTGTHVGAGYGGTASFVGVSCGLSCGYGRLVILNHPSGYQTYYGHLDTFIISNGQSVSQNQDIARRGNTGGSTGPHVHYEIRRDGTALFVPGTAGQSITRNAAVPNSYPGLSAPASRWYYDGGTDGWTPGNSSSVMGWTASGWPGIIYTDQTGNDANWYSPGTSIAAAAEHSINVDVYPQSGTSANHDMQIFWKTSQDNTWTAGKSTPIVTYTRQNAWARINLDVGAWSGTVNQLRLDFDNINSSTRWIVNHVYTQKTPKFWFGSSASGWTVGAGLSGITWTASGWPGIIYADQTGNDAHFVGPGSMDYLGGINDVVRVRVFPQNGATANHEMQVFWATQSSGFSEANSVAITYTAKDAWADLTIPVGHKPEWNGNFIRQLRVDVDGINQGNRWIIDYIAISHLTSPASAPNPPATPPTITTQPASQTVVQNANVTFSVVATGSGLNYQWRFNGANISGAIASSYSRNSVQASDAGNYSVVVSNPGGSVTSANAVLTVNVPPSITAQPASQTVAQGANVTFSVAATGTAPLSYQWKLNGVNISGATASSYTRSNVQAADQGNYSVAVSNVAGAVTSANATLAVKVTVTVDNVNAGFSIVGTWSVATSSPDKLGADYRFRSTGGTGANTATWTANLPNTGTYAVYAWWPQGSNRSTVAPYKVNGGATISVNQQINGGTWNLLGTFSLSAGNNTVSISDNAPAGFVVMADGVRWVQQ